MNKYQAGNTVKALALAVASTSSLTAFAQSAGALEEVIVTAERRESSIQDTPLAITALTSEALERQPYNDLIQLGQRIPALVFTQRLGVLQTTIRGVGGQEFSLGVDPRVAFHSDGVYIARGAAQVSALYDVERLEVISGPQGTLYGRNATAGAVNVITKAPTEDFSGYVTQTVGDYEFYKTNAAVSVPLSEGLAVRVATELAYRDGYGENVYLNEDIDDLDSQAVRGRIRWERDTFRADLIADYYQRSDHGFPSYYDGWLQTPVTPNPPPYINDQTIRPSDRRDTSGDYPVTYENETKGTTLILNWQLSDQFILQSISGYRDNKYSQYGDSDTTNIVASGGSSSEDSDTYSQEFQLTGDFDRTKFVAGLYAFDEKVDTSTTVAGSTIFPGINTFLALRGFPKPPPTEYVGLNFVAGDLKTRSYAGFAQGTYELTDAFRFTLGGRYTWERKEVDRGAQGLIVFGTPLPVFTGVGENFSLPKEYYVPEEHDTWSKVTPTVNIQYDLNSDAMVYLTYAEGFKSGAYGLADRNPQVDPEELSDIEGGLKAVWLDNRLRTNISAYYYDYTNLQVNVLEGTALALKNAADATAYGVQVEITAQVTDSLRVSADGLWQSASFDNFLTADAARSYLGTIDLSGNDLPNSPDYRVAVAADYTIPLGANELTLHLQGTFTGEFYTTPYNLEGQSSPSSSLYDASIEYRMANGFTASVWGNNLSDELTITSAFPPSAVFGNPTNLAYGAPRTYGVRVGYEW